MLVFHTTAEVQVRVFATHLPQYGHCQSLSVLKLDIVYVHIMFDLCVSRDFKRYSSSLNGDRA